MVTETGECSDEVYAIRLTRQKWFQVYELLHIAIADTNDGMQSAIKDERYDDDIEYMDVFRAFEAQIKI